MDSGKSRVFISDSKIRYARTNSTQQKNILGLVELCVGVTSMENKKVANIKNRIWYKALKLLNILFVAFSYLFGITCCFILFRDGHDGTNIILKIVFIIIIVFLFWTASKVPEQFFYFVRESNTLEKRYSKALLVFGILSLSFIWVVAVTIIFPVDTEKGFTITDTAPVGTAEFIQTLANLTNTPAQTGDAVTAIDNIDQFLPTLLNEINSAQTSVDFTTFTWSDGEFSDQVFSALTAAAQRGVHVRLLLDAFGASDLSSDKITALQAAGGYVAKYHLFNPLRPWQYDSRDHMRSIVIDGKVGFTGGVGIADAWLGGDTAPNKTYQDMMFECTGAMAQSIQNTFNDNWNDTTGEVLSGPDFYPPTETTNVNTFVGITSIPSEDDQPVRDAFMLTIMSAQKNLYIVNPYVVPDQGLLTALEDRARAGVDVRILSQGKNTDAPLLRAAWHADYEQLLEAGVKIYEYQPSMIHTKFMVADGTWSLVGSANIDNRSESINNENVIGIADQTLAGTLEQKFTAYLSDSKEFTLADWQEKYGFFSKLYSKILLILFKQY